MPLQRSSSGPAFKANVRTLMGEVGQSPHVQSQKQALAIAYSIKRRGRAEGGATYSPSQMFETLGPVRDNDPLRNAAQPMVDQINGPLESINNAFDVHKPWTLGTALNAALTAVPMGRAPQNSMARKPYMIYNAPEKPPRPFEWDYPSGARTDATGKLTHDIEGRPLTAPHVAGRQVLGGADEAIPSTQFDTLAEATTGRSAQAVPPREMGSDLGRIGLNRVTGRPEYIKYRSDLPPQKAPLVVAHELGHAVDEIAGRMPTTGLTDDFKKIYNTLNNPNRTQGGLEAAPWGKPWTAKAAGYAGEEIPREHVAEAVRSYLTNPNYVKTVAPDVAARIRAYVNAHPELSKIIQFNTLAGGVGLGGIAATNQSEEPHMARGGALDVAYAIRRNRYMGGRLNRAEGGDAEDDSIAMMPPADIGEPVRRAIFPNTGSLLRGEPNPIRDLPETPGKVPSPDYDPRYAGAVGETLPLVLPGVAGLGTRGAGMVARGVGAAMPALEESSLVARGLQAMPRMIADRAPPSIGGLMATMGSSTGEAQEAGSIVVDPTPGEAKEIARINALITASNAKMQQAIRASKYRDPTKDPNVIALQTTLGGLNGEMGRVQGPESPLGQRRAAALDLQKSLLGKQGEANLSAAETKRHAELPYAEKYPGRQEWMQENMPAASGATGAVLGLLGRGKMLKPLVSAALAGGAEGGFTAAWPTLQDAEFLPAGSKNKQAAIDRLYDPNYYKENVVPAIATHGGIAAGASMVGAKARELLGQGGEGASKLMNFARTPRPSAASLPDAAVPAPKPKVVPQIHHTADGIYKEYNHGNRVQWMKDGKIVKKPDFSAQPVMPPNTLHEPPMARGGAAMGVAYAVRRQQRAEGGAVHAGPILSSVPGRTDNHPMDVASGSYVLPADHISSLGEGNTSAGMEVVRHMLGGLGADGGLSGSSESVPINAAGGEFVINPQIVEAIGGGDIARGHKMLDDWVLMNRKKHIRTLSKLPGPAKS